MVKTIRDFNFKGKRVLVRCDFNVPLDNKGKWAKRTSSSSQPSFLSETKVLHDFRIKKSIPTIEYLIKEGAKVVLMSHLGRPGGKVVEGLRLNPIQNRLMEYLDVSITKAPDCIGPEIEKWTREMLPGEILLLENLRFHKEEQENDENFAEDLSKLGDIYINDAFGVCHRNHASVVGVPKYLVSGIGFLLEKELKILTDLMERPKKPLIAIVGGAKVETKMKIVAQISEVADTVLIGGLVKKAITGEHIKLKNSEKVVGPIDEIGGGKDIGPATIELFKEKISQAKTVFWNGPLGLTEKEEFSRGSKEIAEAIISSGNFSIAGVGETAEFLNKLGLIEKFNHISTGGGAMLAFLSGEKLPGIEVLSW